MRATCNLRCPRWFCPSRADSTGPLASVAHASVLLIVAFAVFSSFPTCCIIASERASEIVLRVIHVLRVPVFYLHRYFWMHVVRYLCSVRSFQLQKDWCWASTEDTPQGEEEEEEEEDESSSSSSNSSSSSKASASASASGSGRAPTPEKKAPRSTGLEKDKDKEKEKHKEKEKDKEKGGGGAEGEAVGQQKTELAAAAQEVVVAEGAKGKEGIVKEGKQKGKEKGKEKAGGLAQVAFKIEGVVGPQTSVAAKTTRFEHYEESRQFMNDMEVLFTSHVLCFACLHNASKGVCRVMCVVHVPVPCFRTCFWRTFVRFSRPSGSGVGIGGVWGDAGTAGEALPSVLERGRQWPEGCPGATLLHSQVRWTAVHGVLACGVKNAIRLHRP